VTDQRVDIAKDTCHRFGMKVQDTQNYVEVYLIVSKGKMRKTMREERKMCWRVDLVSVSEDEPGGQDVLHSVTAQGPV